MQMCVKVTTPVKLSLILEKEGTSLIAPEDEMATEVHFVKFEGIPRIRNLYELDDGSIFEQMKYDYELNRCIFKLKQHDDEVNGSKQMQNDDEVNGSIFMQIQNYYEEKRSIFKLMQNNDEFNWNIFKMMW